MVNNKKPLHANEQSMLLSAMLFDQKNIPDLLKFFPDDVAARMNMAKDNFLTLPRNERMTQIVLELRRLLLIDEHRADWIHHSWIDEALLLEPPYLRGIIKEAIETRSSKVSIDTSSPPSKLPLSLIFRMFIEQLTKSPQKTAIYDPALMRLQSLKGDAQDDNFVAIGLMSIQALSLVSSRHRLISYLAKKGLVEILPSEVIKLDANPFNHDALRKYFLDELIRFKVKDHITVAIFSGLITTALYLSGQKYQWQRAIVLGLQKNLGCLIETMIARVKKVIIDQNHHDLLSQLLVRALDQGR